MKMKTLIVLTAAAACLQLSAFSQGLGLNDQLTRNQQVVDAINALANSKMDIQQAPNGNRLDMNGVTSSRGGADTGRPLGLYGYPGSVEFRSGYKDLDEKAKAAWSYDLWKHVVDAGGGWENFQKYRSTPNNTNNANSELAGGPAGFDQAWERSFISYKKLREWSETYWDHYNERFKKTPAMFRDWWLNDAILDGTNLYLCFERSQGNRSADFVMYRDATLAKLAKRE